MHSTWTRESLALLTVLTVLSVPAPALADFVDLPAIKDNTLYETPVGNSNGIGDGVYVGRIGTFGSNTLRRGLMAFDFSSIPSGATIDAVTLALTLAQTPDGAAHDVSLHRVNATWGEAGSLGSGSGGPAQPGDATWLERLHGSTAWASPGGDFVALASGSQTVADVGPYQWSSAGLVADVQAWVDSPASNHGWLLLGNESGPRSAKKFYSREGFTPPSLHVEYTPSNVGTDPITFGSAISFASPAPSPAIGPVRLGYALPRAARVSLAIHDAAGRVVRWVIAEHPASAGRHETIWDGRGDAGEPLAAGVYVARLVVDGGSFSRRIALLR